ncbi:MAG TPA: LptF/LptG family permease, partial [Micavibrio sp.]
RYELIIVRAAGLSVWQFLTPVLAVAVGAGIIMTTLINPLGSMLLGRFDQLEANYLNAETPQISLLQEGLWLRQEASDNGRVILHAGKVKLPEWELQDVMALFFTKNGDFKRRIDAASAQLGEGQWTFRDVISNTVGQPGNEKIPYMVLATSLTTEKIEESFAEPQALSFWKLPTFIRTLDTTGFDSVPIKVHFQSLLAQPLLYAAMILLAASVSLRPPRFRGAFMLAALGVGIGFMVFFLSSFLQAMGASHQIPVLLAAWAPAMVSFLLGLAVILNLEDG